MKRILLSIAVLALLACAPRAARSADLSVDFFYNNLPGGNWIEVADYGYCWQPDVAVNNEGWRPYADGYWAYTDLGWTWVSYEDFGWATYHYGRWLRLEGYGWVWVPGRDEDLEWGPAWVSWRFGDNYVGWAPLPPDTIAVEESRPISGHIDIEFNIGPAYYNFVAVRDFGDPVLRQHIVPVAQNVTYIEKTVNVTNITYKNKTVYNYGPDIATIDREASRPIQRLHLQRETNANLSAAAKSGALTRVQGDKFMVAAPMRVTKAGQAAPRTVKAKVDKSKVERGWSVVGNQTAQEQFKQKIKGQNLKQIPAASQESAMQGGRNAGPTPPAGRRGEMGMPATSSGAQSANAAAEAKQGERKDQNRSGERGQFSQPTPGNNEESSTERAAAESHNRGARHVNAGESGQNVQPAQGEDMGQRNREPRPEHQQKGAAEALNPNPGQQNQAPSGGERRREERQTFSQPGGQGGHRGEARPAQEREGRGEKGKGQTSPTPHQ
jgi:Family of unknown function (DUF6600)